MTGVPRGLALLCLAFSPLCGTDAGHCEILINEIAFHPITDSSREEFVELHNSGAEVVDLSGWGFSNGIDFDFPANATLEAGGYLVVAKDPDLLSSLYPYPLLVHGPYDGQLDNGGETLALSNELGEVVDQVAYNDSLPWANASDGEGPTLELRNPALDNTRHEHWAASDLTVSSTAAWRTLEVTLEPVDGEFFFYLTDLDGAGWIGDAESVHVLFDEMRLEDLSAPGINLITDGGLEVGDGSEWVVEGPQQARFLSREDSFAGAFCLHYWALESGNAASNALRYRPTPPLALSSGNTYRFTCRYRVIHGSALVWMGAGGVTASPGLLLETRAAWGTPGAINSVHGPVDTPVLTDLHEIANPLTAGASAEVVAAFNDPTALASVELWFSTQEIGFSGLVPTPDQQVWQSLPMTADSAPNSATFRVQLPGQTGNTILRYHLRWSDLNGGHHRYPGPDSHPDNLVTFVPGNVPDYSIPSFFLHLDPSYYQFFLDMLNSGDVAPGTPGIFRPTRPTFAATFIDLEEGRAYEDVVWKPRGWDNLNNALLAGFRTGHSIQFRAGDYYRGDKRELDINNNLSRRREAGVRTRLAHEVYRRAGIPVSRSRYLWSYLNGVPMGLMTDLESPDNVFLERWGRDGSGSLYKARWAFRGPSFSNENLLRGNEQVYPFIEDYPRCYLKKNRRDSNHADLIAMCANLNAPHLVGRVFEMEGNGSDVASQRTFFENEIDLDNILVKYGVDHILANHDRGQQNHYLYQDLSRDGRWETYPWDLDLTWDIGERDLWNTLGRYDVAGNISVDTALFTPAFFFYEAEPFFTRLVSVPEFRKRYVTGVRDLLKNAFSERQLFEVLDRYEEEGRDAFAQDIITWPGVVTVDSGAINYCNDNGIPTDDPLRCVIAWFKDRVKRARQAAFWRARSEDQDGYTIPPVLSDGRTSPLVPTPSDTLEFRVNALSAGFTAALAGIQSVTVHYRINGGSEQTTNMARVNLVPHDGDYRAQIAAFPDGTSIEYWFDAVDSLGLIDRLPGTGSFTTEVVADQAASENLVVINEIMYHSDQPGNEWIEIHNPSERTVDVSRWILGDMNPDHRFRLPVDLMLPPGGFLVVAANEFVVKEHYGIQVVVGDFEFNFSNSGDTLSLFDDTGLPIDTVAYGDDAPWPTDPDGSGPSLELIDPNLDNSEPTSWQASSAPAGTPGRGNGPSTIPGAIGSIVINEFSYDPTDLGITNDYNGDGIPDDAQDEFVELYNTTGADVDLSGWTVDDDDPMNGNTFVFPQGALVPAHGFVVVFNGGIPTGFGVPTFTGLPRLGNGGDQIRLRDGTKEIDSVGFESGATGTMNDLTATADGGVIARSTDGSPNFESRGPELATVGASNDLSSPDSTATATPSPTLTVTATPSAEPSQTPTLVPDTFTPTPSATLTPTQTITPESTPTPTSTLTMTQMGTVTPTVDADLNEDRSVDALDLLRLLKAWNSEIGEASPEDLHPDGLLNLKDLALFQDYWKETTGGQKK
jgi:hypothetical protein